MHYKAYQFKGFVKNIDNTKGVSLGDPSRCNPTDHLLISSSFFYLPFFLVNSHPLQCLCVCVLRTPFPLPSIIFLRIKNWLLDHPCASANRPCPLSSNYCSNYLTAGPPVEYRTRLLTIYLITWRSVAAAHEKSWSFISLVDHTLRDKQMSLAILFSISLTCSS